MRYLNFSSFILANFTKAAHFGGGGTDDVKDRKTVIEELIADSKKRKNERAKEHEEMFDMTSKLDLEWKDLLPVVNQMQRSETPEKPEMDDYDRLVKEMIFLPRGEPTQKLKTEEDLAQIEKDKLEKLEKERLQRMKGEEEIAEEAKSTYRSADDLDDGYFLEPVMEDDDRVISYPINDDNENESEQVNQNEMEQADNDSPEGESEGGDDEEEQEAESSEESDDDLEDLKEDLSESENSSSEEEEEEVLEKSQNEKSMKENALESLPFTIQLPDEYEKFIKLLNNQSIKIQLTIVDRIIKTNHPKLHYSNRQKMIKLFAYLLQYVNDLFSNCDDNNISKHFKLLNQLTPHLFDLIHMNSEDCSKSFLEVIKEKHEEFAKSRRTCPKLDTIVFFRLAGVLFPTSDFRHPVVTPTYVFLHHILSQAKINSRYDISAGLFLSTLVLDFQQISKRFLPAVMNFIVGVCYLGVKKSLLDAINPIPPFKKMDELLVLGEKFDGDFKTSSKLSSNDFLNSTIDNDFKVRSLNVAICLMRDFVHLYEDVMGVKYFIEPFERILKRLLNEDNLPTEVIDNINKVLEQFTRIGSEKSFKFPEPAKKSTPMLRMFEPRFETVSTDRRSMYCQAEGKAAEKKKLQHMYKREFKAAKRELRRDNEFVSKIKQKRQQATDTERKEKVKRIFDEASMQQQEFKALSRTKGRKSFF